MNDIGNLGDDDAEEEHGSIIIFKDRSVCKDLFLEMWRAHGRTRQNWHNEHLNEETGPAQYEEITSWTDVVEADDLFFI